MRKLLQTHRLAILTITMMAFAVCVHFGVVPHAHAAGIGLMALVTTPFPVNTELTAIAIGYQNTQDMLIADKVLPRVPTAETFKWTQYAEAQAYTVPETRVGRKSEPTMITFNGTEVNDSVDDFALDDFIPNRDIEVFDAMPKPVGGGPGPISPQALSTQMLTNLLWLAREIRVADLVFNTANYSAGNQQTLAGTSQWSDFTGSDPLSDILNALDTPLVRPNTIVLGRQVATILRQHPKIVQAVFRTAQNAGAVSMQQLADLFEVREVLVGSSRVNTAKRGQAATFARVWGKNAALIYVDPLAAQTFQPTYGFTAEFGTKIAGAFPDQKKGIKGGETIRVGEQVKEIISAPDSGYYFQNAIA